MVSYDPYADEVDLMMCARCGKHRQVGRQVSHANNRTARTFRPNIQTVHVMVNGEKKRLRLCTRCLRSGRAQRIA